MSNLKDRVWLTSKSHIFAEVRFNLYDVTSHIFLTSMSLLMIIAAIFYQEFATHIPYFDKITVTISLIIFTTSLIIYGFKFKEIANLHRECYLKLQALEREFDNNPEPEKIYQTILDQYPNHSPRDYEELILARTCFGNETLSNGGREITWTFWMLLMKAIRFVIFWGLIFGPPLLAAMLFAWPLLASANPTS